MDGLCSDAFLFSPCAACQHGHLHCTLYMVVRRGENHASVPHPRLPEPLDQILAPVGQGPDPARVHGPGDRGRCWVLLDAPAGRQGGDVGVLAVVGPDDLQVRGVVAGHVGLGDGWANVLGAPGVENVGRVDLGRIEVYDAGWEAEAGPAGKVGRCYHGGVGLRVVDQIVERRNSAAWSTTLSPTPP